MHLNRLITVIIFSMNIADWCNSLKACLKELGEGNQTVFVKFRLVENINGIFIWKV
jgi:hypothetical protein